MHVCRLVMLVMLARALGCRAPDKLSPDAAVDLCIRDGCAQVSDCHDGTCACTLPDAGVVRCGVTP